MKKIGFFIISAIILSLLGCKKPNANPELMDPIYTDLVAEKALAVKNLEDQKKQLLDLEKQYSEAKPQTGQLKPAQRKVEDARIRIHKFKQQVLYFEVKIANRKIETRKKYMTAFLNNQEWPDKKEIDEYMAIQKLRRAKINSDNKAREPAQESKSAENHSAPPAEHH